MYVNEKGFMWYLSWLAIIIIFLIAMVWIVIIIIEIPWYPDLKLIYQAILENANSCN